METNTVIVIAVVAIVFVALLLVIRSRRTPISHDAASHDAVTRSASAETHGVVGSAATAVEDVVGALFGVDVHPDLADGPADDLTVLKGLGPKAAAQLRELGVCRYAQIAAWSEENVAAVDARLGAFKGRIVRDKWVEQARYLAAGDKAGFEAAFGKLGS